jgi:hypothetical protein
MSRAWVVWVALSAWGVADAPDVAGQESRSVEPEERACVADAWRAVALEHLDRYPLAGLDDIYKLIQQGVFGSDHAIPSVAEAEAWLRDEVESLGAEAPVDEPLLEVIAPDSAVLRVNLRPFLAAGGELGKLLDAFVRTSSRVHGEPATFRCAAAAVASALPGVSSPAWEAVVTARIAEGLPAAHHSAAYAQAYRPAYRVIAKPYLVGLGVLR